jgi:hypothetical protein
MILAQPQFLITQWAADVQNRSLANGQRIRPDVVVIQLMEAFQLGRLLTVIKNYCSIKKQ